MNPLPEDAPVTDQFRRIGIGLDKPFDAASLSAPTKRGLTRALQDGMAAVQRVAKDSGSRVNGWNMEFKGGEYGNDFLLRSAIGYKQLGLNRRYARSILTVTSTPTKSSLTDSTPTRSDLMERFLSRRSGP
ncbi:hypothetical protein ACFIOY_09810 [Bradyrhizobium sp. TZ2]